MAKPDFVHHQFFRAHVAPMPGPAMVTGSYVWPGRYDDRLLFERAIGLDMQEGLGVDAVHDLEAPNYYWTSLFSHVMCCSVLEHVRRPWLAAENLQDWMKSGATIQISAPFIWRVHGYPNDYWRFTPEGIKVLFPKIEWEVALLHYNNKFHESTKVKAVDKMFPRTEVHMFGRKAGS